MLTSYLAWQSNFIKNHQKSMSECTFEIAFGTSRSKRGLHEQFHVTPFSSRPALWIWLLLWTIFSSTWPVLQQKYISYLRLYLVYIIEHCLADDSTMSGVGTSRSSLNLTMAVWSGCRATSIKEEQLPPTHNQHQSTLSLVHLGQTLFLRLIEEMSKCP